MNIEQLSLNLKDFPDRLCIALIENNELTTKINQLKNDNLNLQEAIGKNKNYFMFNKISISYYRYRKKKY